MNESTSKPSGLRPPSKIGRPCFGSAPKPAVPQTPKTNGTTSSVRKLTEDLLKTRINEEIEEDEPFHGYGRRRSSERKSSIGGVSSNDSLWGDARRLSEAGVRRASDNSVILTEDTDSFIVGDKVWVGGTKPGRIAFIGETQFAAGDWAGIVLDEPIGKNDGSVGGTRYFQCEPKKGVFARLGRLTRYPMSVPSPPFAPSPSPPLSVTPTSKRATPPPVPRTPPLLSPPSPAPSTKGEPAVGDRVIVMSGQGSKIGILRYRGETDFSSGIWCGVELDDPIGKNDGSVEGIRYFECLPKYGLFAPAAKVSRSPAPDRRPSCQLHHSVRRASSKESLTSVTSRASTIASTASRVRLGVNSLKKPMPRPSTAALGTPRATPQELLKTKQDQIEKLLKERDLDRSPMVKAAEQTEEAEKQLNLHKAEFELFRVESQKKIQELEDNIKKVQQEKSDLETQLEDWKFRAEEGAIFKSTLEEEQEEQQQCMDAWKKAFTEKEQEVKNLRLQIIELKEAKEEIDRLKNDLETLKERATENENELKKELIDTIDRANRMEQNYNDVQNKFDNQSSLKDEISPLKETISKLESSLSESEKKCTDLEKAYSQASEAIKKEKSVSEDVKLKFTLLENKLKEAEEFNKLLGEEDRELKTKCTELSKLSSQVSTLQEELLKVQTDLKESNEENKVLKKNIDELHANKTSMLEEQEGLQKSLNEWKVTLMEKEGEIKALFLQVGELNETKLLMSSLKEETETFRKKASEIENELRKELIETVERANRMEEKFNETQEKFQFCEEEMSAEVASLKDTIASLEISLINSEKSCSTLEMCSKETDSKIKEQEKVIESMKREAHDLEYKLKEAETYNKLLGEGEQKLKSQCAEMSNLLTQVTQLRDDLNDAQKKYKNALEQNESLLKELDEIQASSNNKLIDIDRKYNNDIQNLKRKLEEFSSELSNKEKELSEEKIKVDEHEREFSSLQKEVVDLKNCLEVNQNNLNDRETEISLLKKDLEDTKGQLTKSLELFELKKTEDAKKINELSDELNKVNISVADLLNEQNNLSASFEEEKKALTDKMTALESTKGALGAEVNVLKNDIDLKSNELTSLQAKYSEVHELCGKQTSDLESKTSHIKKLESQIADSENERKNLVVINEELKQSLEEKMKSLDVLSDHLATAELKFKEEKDTFTDEIKALKQSLILLEGERDELTKCDKNWKESFSNKESEITKLLAEINELNNSIKNYANLENDFKIYKEEQLKTEKELSIELESSLGREKLLKEYFDDTKSQLSILEKRNSEELLSLKENISELKNLLSESERKRETLQMNLVSSELTSKEQEVVMQQLKKEFREIEYKLQETETYNKLLGEEEQELKNKCADLSNLMTQVSQLQEELSAVGDNYKVVLNENEKLKKELTDLQSFKSEMLSEKEKLQQSVDWWKKNVSDKENELLTSRNALSSKNEEINYFKEEFLQIKNKLENDLKVANDRNGELQGNLDCLKNIMEIERMESEGEKSKLNEKIITLGNSLSNFKDSNSVLERKLDTAETKIQELESCVGSQKNIIDDLHCKLKSAEELHKKFICEEEQKLLDKCTEINNLSSELESVKDELAKLKDENQKILNQRDEVLSSLADLESLNTIVQKDKEDLQLSMDKTKALLSEKETIIINLSTKFDELSETKNSLSHTMDDLNKFKKDSTEREEKLKEELTREMDKSIILEKRLNDTQYHFDLLKRENNNEIIFLKENIGKLESSLLVSQTSRDEMSISLNESESKVNKLESEVARLIEINDDLQIKLLFNTNLNEETEKLLMEKSEEINNLSTQLHDIRENLTLSENKLKSSAEENATLKDELNYIKSSSENEIKDLNSKFKKEIDNLQTKVEEFSVELNKKHKELSDEKLISDEHEKEKISLQTNLNNSMFSLSDKEKEIHFLKNELEKSKQELNAIKALIEGEKLTFSEKYSSLQNELQSAKETITLLENEKNNIISAKDDMNDAMKNNISSLKNNVSDLLAKVQKYKNKESSKASELLLVKDKYREIVDSFEKQSLELSTKSLKVEELQVSVEDLSKKYQMLLEKESELEKLKFTSSALSSEKESVYEELVLAKKNAEEVTSKLLKIEEDASKKEKLLTDEIANMKSQFEKVNSEFKTLSETSEKTKEDLESKCKDLTKALEEIQKSSEQKDKGTIEKLKKTEEENKTLLTQINERRESEKQLEEIVKNLNSQLEKEKSTNIKFTNNLEILKKENQNKINVLEAQMKVLVREKELLEDKTKQLSNEVSSLKTTKTISEGPEDIMAAWLEEKELAASEINFLNSIIVDMKKKNDALNERIQAMEMGEACHEMNRIKKKKAVTPRMFCDICDVFDAHETEDCPRQASADSPPPVQSHSPMARGTVRPYCEICEMFGHNTEDCDDTQTY